MVLPFDELREGLLPEEKEFSIVQIDVTEPPGSSDAAVKLYEVDDLNEVMATQDFDTFFMAYDSGGNGTKIE